MKTTLHSESPLASFEKPTRQEEPRQHTLHRRVYKKKAENRIGNNVTKRRQVFPRALNGFRGVLYHEKPSLPILTVRGHVQRISASMENQVRVSLPSRSFFRGRFLKEPCSRKPIPSGFDASLSDYFVAVMRLYEGFIDSLRT